MEEKTLIELLDKYEHLQYSIGQNRKESKALIKLNKDIKKEIKETKKQIGEIIKKEKETGASLYQIVKQHFGKIDRRFYLLYSLL